MSIGHRLFLAMLLSAVAVSLVGVALLRWTLFMHPQAPVAAAPEPVDALAGAFAAQYRRHGGWTFLPAGEADRDAWLRATVAALPERPGASSNLESRIGLLDRDAHPLAGAVAHPALVAFASIDTIRRAVEVDGETVGHVVVAKPRDPDDALVVAFLLQRQRSLFAIAVIGLVLAAIAASLLAANVRRPIRGLVDGARRLERAQFETRLDARRRDELGELAEAFNHLAARLQEAERERRQWVADTSHELRTPLSVLLAQMESLQDGVRAATPDNIALMLRQVRGLSRLVDELYTFARADIGQLRCEMAAHDAWALVREAMAGFSGKFEAAGLAADVGAAPACATVHCDAGRIRQVLDNLLENSVRYTAAGGRIEANAVVEGDLLRVSIDDSAPGVPDASLARLGERFHRVDASRSRETGGAGLGLALCRQILAAHGGTLEFSPSPLGGLRAVFTLSLGD